MIVSMFFGLAIYKFSPQRRYTSGLFYL